MRKKDTQKQLNFIDTIDGDLLTVHRAQNRINVNIQNMATIINSKSINSPYSFVGLSVEVNSKNGTKEYKEKLYVVEIVKERVKEYVHALDRLNGGGDIDTTLEDLISDDVVVRWTAVDPYWLDSFTINKVVSTIENSPVCYMLNAFVSKGKYY